MTQGTTETPKGAFETLDIRAIAPLLVLFGGVAVSTAWMCDDAFITWRTIDHLVQGNGLVWNPGERVQAYTHPLWLFLQAAVFLVVRDAYLASVFTCLAFSVFAVWMLLSQVARSNEFAFAGALALVMSKAFVDYSTSGLENALGYALLSVFMAIWIGRIALRPGAELLSLSLLTSCALLTRQDFLLILAPPLAGAMARHGIRFSVPFVLLGLLPAALWHGFSLAYYGFLFPNTAYAKLHTDIWWYDLMSQGFMYVLNCVRRDLVTVVLILCGIVSGFCERDRRRALLALGLVLYVAYVVRVGGDFMAGRFFAVPCFVAVGLLVNQRVGPAKRLSALSFAVMIVVSRLTALPSDMEPLRASRAWDLVDPNGIADERHYYFPGSGLTNSLRLDRMPRRTERTYDERLVEMSVVGYRVYFNVDLSTPVLDRFALGDPLLARLPAEKDWRIGHFSRRIPEGYAETLQTGENLLRDENLRAYYDRLSVLTKGPLWSWGRWMEILRFNLGGYDDLRARYVESLRKTTTADALAEVKGDTYAWDGVGVLTIPDEGLDVALPGLTRAESVDVSLDHNDYYRLEFYNGERRVGRLGIGRSYQAGGGLTRRRLQIPGESVKRGFDRVLVLPLAGDGKFSVGHLVLGNGSEQAPGAGRTGAH